MNDTILADEKYHTHLGLTLSSDVTCDEHIRLNLLRMLKFDLDRQTLQLRYYISYIRPTLEYADIVWDNMSQHNDELLERKYPAGRMQNNYWTVKEPLMIFCITS